MSVAGFAGTRDFASSSELTMISSRLGCKRAGKKQAFADLPPSPDNVSPLSSTGPYDSENILDN